MLISLVFQTEICNPFSKKSMSNLKKLCAIHVKMFDFLWPSSYKRWAYPKISPVTCEWWRYIFILIIVWAFSKSVLVVKVSTSYIRWKIHHFKTNICIRLKYKFWNFSFAIVFNFNIWNVCFNIIKITQLMESGWQN